MSYAESKLAGSSPERPSNIADAASRNEKMAAELEQLLQQATSLLVGARPEKPSTTQAAPSGLMGSQLMLGGRLTSCLLLAREICSELAPATR